VARLNGELEAIGAALTEVGHEGLSPVAPISMDDDAVAGSRPERQRA
jgi:hypothetical protein